MVSDKWQGWRWNTLCRWHRCMAIRPDINIPSKIILDNDFPPTHIHSPSLHSFQSGQARRCDTPSLRNRYGGDGWVPWWVVVAIARRSPGIFALQVICGYILNPSVRLYAWEPLARESYELDRELKWWRVEGLWKVLSEEKMLSRLEKVPVWKYVSFNEDTDSSFGLIRKERIQIVLAPRWWCKSMLRSSGKKSSLNWIRVFDGRF
jgi:hypothetical protein